MTHDEAPARHAADATGSFARGAEAAAPSAYVLRLFVTGMTARSQRAIEATRQLCEQHLAGHYALEVVDISQNPGSAREEQILAAPTLLKQEPPPVRRLIGDLSRTDRVLHALGIPQDP